MRNLKLDTFTVDQLVERFVTIGIAQAEATFHGDNRKYRKLFSQMKDVTNELRSRPGDQRRALVALYNHPNTQVRLRAAKTTLAVSPKEARQVIESIAASHELFYAGDAGMCLFMLDSGDFVPD